MELPAEGILDAISSSVVVTDPNAPDNPITYVNPAFEKDTGYASEDAVGQNCRFLQGPGTEESVLEELRQALAEGREWSGILRNYRKNGEPFWNEVSISAIRDASGEITSFVGVQNDVSEKVWAEERLKELSDGAFEGIMVLAEGKIIEINQVLANMFGYEPSEVVGSSPLAFIAPEYRDHSISVMATGSEEPYESVGIRKDGSRFEVEAQARHSTNRGNTVRTVALRDITERKKVKREREESERRLRSALLRYGSDVITILDSEGTVLYVSPSIEQSLGKKPEEHIGENTFDLFHPDDVEVVAEMHAKGLGEGEAGPPVEFRLQHADGSWHYFEGIATNLLSDPEAGGIVVNSRDVTERKRAERAMQESEERFRTLADAALEGLVVMNMEGQILETNQAYLEIFGFESEEIIGQAPKIDAMPGTIPESQETVRQNVVSRYEKPYEIVGRRKDGTRIDLQLRGRSSTYRGQEARITALRDITERKRAEEELRESEERFRRLADATFEGIIVSEGGVITDVNPTGAGMVGYETSEIIGKGVLELIAPEYHEEVKQSVATGSEAPYELEVLRKDDTRIEAEVRGRNYHYKGRSARVSAIRDISEQKSLERRLRYQALHDPLTGLPNRTLFNDRLTQSLERTARSGEAIAVMFLDLDDFKGVNDTLGHSAGDKLLVSVAGRISECLRASDTVSRMGGDEFTVLLDGVEGESETSQIAQRVVEQLRYPVAINDGGMEREVSATASMGVVLAAPGVDSGATSEELLKWADTALYQAKDSGKDHYLFFHPEMEERSLERSSVEEE